jgi:hypothetical protein
MGRSYKGDAKNKKNSMTIPASQKVSLRQEGSKRASKCAVHEIANGQIHLLAPNSLADATKVTLKFDHVAIPGTVLSSRQSEDFYRTCVEVTPSDHVRRDPRFPLDESCFVSVLESGDENRIKGYLTDFSKSGLGIRSESYVEIGMMVYVETRSLLIAGEVRHCLPRLDGTLKVGLETTDIFSDFGQRRPLPIFYRFRRCLAELILGHAIRF